MGIGDVENMTLQGMPPYTNRGAGNTSSKSSIALVDWLQVTLHGVETLQQVKDLFGLSELEMLEMDNGYFGYPEMVQSNNISIMWRNDRAEYHVMMTGQGCRFFETVTTVNWISLLGYLLYGVKSNFTRIDIAVDDFEGTFTMNTIRRKIQAKNPEVVSKLKTADILQRIKLVDGTTLIDSVRFGSEKSRLLIRMYDKKMEREKEGHEVLEKSWVRTELQFRKEYANQVVEQLYATDFNVGMIVKGHLKNYLRFVVPSDDKNKARWAVSPFWEKFLSKVEKLKLSLSAPDRTIETVKKAIEKQYGPSLSMLDKALGTDELIEFLVDLTIQSETRLKKKHDQMIEDYHQRLNMEKQQRMKSHDNRMDKQRDERIHDKNKFAKKLLTIYNNSQEKKNPPFERENPIN